MRKILLMLSVILLAACGNELKGIEVEEESGLEVFTFDEIDFRKMYEENTGKSIPIGFEYHDVSSIGVRGANANQVEGFLKTSYDLLGDDVIKKMYNSFREDREELIPGDSKRWRKVATGDRVIVDYGILENGQYISSIYINISFD